MNVIVSIVIPTLNEEKYIEKCINSILEMDYPKDKIEVLFVDGRSNDKTRDLINLYASQYKFIRIIDNPEKIVPIAMNKGIRESRGKYIMRLDAHSEYPKNYISKLIYWKEKLNADNVGAVCESDVINKNKISSSIAKVLKNKFGVGNSLFRVGVDKPMKVDTVPFGLYKRDIFERVGYYDERLERNQDIELNKRILKNGGTIYLVPDVRFKYFARDNLKSLWKNNYLNGKWNILTIIYTKDLRSLSIRHFIPLIFVLSILIPILLSFFYEKLIIISIISFIAYNFLVFIISFRINDRTSSFWNLIKSFYILHISYGIGSIVGILKGTFKGKN
ncbi:MAG: glycosyltransferase family 2 protein [Paraclostridium sp.]|uniref:glycosyltransferase family 2 protein n=1 Tax=Paraclostridium sp. TaxID=2023273 RepID=UPI003EE6D375